MNFNILFLSKYRYSLVRSLFDALLHDMLQEGMSLSAVKGHFTPACLYFSNDQIFRLFFLDFVYIHFYTI